MRSVELQKGDTLRQIAHRFYYVYDDEGVAQPERVDRVLREIIKRNPSIIKYFGTPSSQPYSLKMLLASDSEDLEKFADQPCNVDQRPLNSQKPPLFSRLKQWLFNRQKPTCTVLPKIIGIPFYETDNNNPSGKKWLYFLFWAAGLIAGFCFYLYQQYLIQLPLMMASQNQPQKNGMQDAANWLRWLKNQLEQFIQNPKLLLDASAPGIIIWSLAVLSCWLFLRPPTSTPVHQSRVRYLLGWAAGLIVLVPGMYYGLTVLVPGAVPVLLPFTELLPLFVIWTIVVFLGYLYHGDGSAAHQDYFGKYRSIWTVFALLVMGTVLAGYTGYQQVSRRIQGEMSALTLADTTIRQLRDTTHALRSEAEDLAQKTNTGDPDAMAYVLYHWLNIRRYADSAVIQARDADHALDAAGDHFSQITQTLQDEQKKQNDQEVRDGYDSRIAFAREQSNALQQIDIVLTTALTTTENLHATADSIQPVLLQQAQAGKGLSATVVLSITNDLVGRAQDAELQANVAANSITAVAFDGLPVFLWNSILYAALVLFPWMLVLLFFYRKRKRLAAGIYHDLYRLDPSGRALENVLSGADTREEEKLIDRVLKGIHKQPARAASNGQSLKHRDWKLKNIQDWLNALSSSSSNNGTSQPKVASNSRSPISGATLLNEDEAEAVIEELAIRTFNENAYLISLLLLSLLAAVGWYYVFYPQGAIGLANLIVSGADVRQLNALITTNLTPLTMGFVGGYFFLMQMLVRRYLANDLYPTAFLQAALRLVIVFTLCLALSKISFSTPNTMQESAISGAVLIAFLAGVFPTAGLQLIISYVNRLQQNFRFPTTVIPEPITKLTGVTIWVESRLLEENIETVQGMATAPIEQLIAGTHYPAAQIVDWVDQAILYMHSGHDGEWFASFRSVGVRSATDLLDALGFNLLRPFYSLLQGPDLSQYFDFVPKKDELAALARAINDANDAGILGDDLNDQRSAIVDIAGRLTDTSAQAATIASQAAALINQINPNDKETFKIVKRANDRAVALAPDKLETLDARDDLRAKIDQLDKATQTMQLDVGRLQIDLKSSTLVRSPARQQGVRAVLASIDTTVQALPPALDELRQYATSLYQLNPDLTQKERVSSIEQKFADVRGAIKDTSCQLKSLIEVPRMTEDILRIIAASIWPDPNMAYILNYNYGSLECLNKSDPLDPTLQILESAIRSQESGVRR